MIDCSREKLEILCKAVQQTMNDFKRNKQARRLTYNEEQIHKFEKSVDVFLGVCLELRSASFYPLLKVVFVK